MKPRSNLGLGQPSEFYIGFYADSPEAVWLHAQDLGLLEKLGMDLTCLASLALSVHCVGSQRLVVGVVAEGILADVNRYIEAVFFCWFCHEPTVTLIAAYLAASRLQIDAVKVCLNLYVLRYGSQALSVGQVRRMLFVTALEFAGAAACLQRLDARSLSNHIKKRNFVHFLVPVSWVLVCAWKRGATDFVIRR